MALSFEDFCKLSEKEQGEQYRNLSDSDKFLVRCSMNSYPIFSQCNNCKWRFGRGVCNAFPKGIPKELLLNYIKHDNPYPGDHGILYEKKPSE